MFLGIEIGGTKLQLGLGNGDGVISALWRGTVNAAAGSDGIRQQIVSAVPELLAKANADRGSLKGIGIGFGGPTDDHTQTVIKSHQIAGWDDFPLAKWMSDLIGVPAVLGNDADVAGLAEALFGAGKGLSPVFYITVGTGVGGGLIIDGQIYRGVGRGAAEIGHLRVRHPSSASPSPPNPLSLGERESKSKPPLPQGEGVGGEGEHTVEAIASGDGIAIQAAALLRSGRNIDAILKHSPTGVVTAKAVAVAALEGDEAANRLLGNARQALAEGICSVIALLCPKRIVIGGGVSLMGEDLFFRPLRQLVAERVFKPFAGLTDIVPAALGEEMVVHGALALARQRFGG